MAYGIDTINPDALPATFPQPVDYVGGYVDGNWPDADRISLLHPTARPIRFTAIPGSATALSATVADCEKGDYSAAQAAQFAKTKLAWGVVPGVYCSESVWSDVKTACFLIGVNVAQVDWLIAGYPGSVGAGNLYPGAVGHQYNDAGTYDEWVILDGWIPGRQLVNFATTVPNPSPAAPAAPIPGGNVNVPTLQIGSNGGWVKSVQALARDKAGQSGLKVDGAFGPATAGAIRNVQSFFHLTVDGVVGPVTWGLLLGL